MPYNAGQNLLGRCLFGSFCISATCVGFPQPPKLTSVSRALCALVSAPQAGLCIVGLVWTCFSSLCPPSASWSLCAFVSSHCLHCLSRGLFVLSAVQGGLCVLPRFVCLPSIGTTVPPFALAVFVCRLPGPALCAARVVRAGWGCLPHHTRLPGPALCAARIVCADWVCTPHHSWFPEPEPESAVCLGPQSMSC